VFFKTMSTFTKVTKFVSFQQVYGGSVEFAPNRVLGTSFTSRSSLFLDVDDLQYVNYCVTASCVSAIAYSPCV